MHQTAIRYFNGTISREDEVLLEEFIRSDKKHMAMFRRWEEEWTENHAMSEKVAEAYRQFAWQTEHYSHKHAMRRKVWRRVAATAAILVLLGGGVLATWQWSKPRQEKYYTCTVPYGSKTCMELPDGTVVWLNAGSKLRYSDRFNEDNRHVELDGEGYFDVKKQEGKTFTVKTNACDITVKGTRFDVSAYGDDELTSVSLMQGSVLVNSLQGEMSMAPGEKVTVDRQSGKISRSVYESTANTWINNNIDYESITLGELTKILARQFNVKFVIRSSRLSNVRFSVMLKQKESITDVMTSLQTVQPMTVVKEGRNIYISD